MNGHYYSLEELIKYQEMLEELDALNFTWADNRMKESHPLLERLIDFDFSPLEELAKLLKEEQERIEKERLENWMKGYQNETQSL